MLHTCLRPCLLAQMHVRLRCASACPGSTCRLRGSWPTTMVLRWAICGVSDLWFLSSDLKSSSCLLRAVCRF